MRFFTEDNSIYRVYSSYLKEESQTSREETIGRLSNFLKGDLAPYAQDFVDAGEKYGVDPLLMASIATLETGWGTAPVLTKHKNISGRYDQSKGTHYTYSNIRDSIYDQARFLRAGYLDKGLNTIEAIGRKYAPPGASNDPNNTNKDWPDNVRKLYAQVSGGSTEITPYNNVAGNEQSPEPEIEDNSIVGGLKNLTTGFDYLKKSITGS